jgi:SAM-dependent methyltransferase
VSTHGRAEAAWDEEYRRAGIPSSYRREPSKAVLWALDNWRRAGGAGDRPRRALDVGCGGGRNSAHLAALGVDVTGFDASTVAIERARRRLGDARVTARLLVHDLRSGLPARDAEVDLALDVFVYKHQIQPDERRAYREELARVLAPEGRVLLSLAEPDDGYYSTCPPWPEAGAGPNAVVDPETGVGSVLFSLDALAAEVADVLTLVMVWRQERMGVMHGRRYLRRTSATLWRRV